jgi:hypothetical protein
MRKVQIAAFAAILLACVASAQGQLQATQRGCNGVHISEGFSGVDRVGLTTDGINRLYISINGQGVWRYTISTRAMQLVSTGGNDPNTGALLAFAFVGAYSNLLKLGPAGQFVDRR